MVPNGKLSNGSLLKLHKWVNGNVRLANSVLRPMFRQYLLQRESVERIAEYRGE